MEKAIEKLGTKVKLNMYIELCLNGSSVGN